MTISPDPQNPASDSPTTTDATVAAPSEVPAAVPSAVPAPAPQPPTATPPAATPAPAPTPPAPPATDPALDAGTYTRLREPKASGALALDGTWHQISPRYVTSQFIQYGLLLALIAVAALVLALAFGQSWAWIPAGVIAAVIVFTLVILPRQARAIGYMLRSDDIVFRKGILWQRMIAVPYGRLQLVDITHGPLDRAFGVAQLKMVTAAATTGVQIPGLTQDAATALRDTLIEVAETRRTGL